MDWAACTGNMLNVDECDIIFAMDRAFMTELQSEIRANQERAQRRADAAAKQRKR